MNQPTTEQLASYMWSHEKGSDPAMLTEASKDDWRCLAKGILEAFWPRWISLEVRLPKEKDADRSGHVWVCRNGGNSLTKVYWTRVDGFDYWMPITKPQPPTE